MFNSWSLGRRTWKIPSDAHWSILNTYNGMVKPVSQEVRVMVLIWKFLFTPGPSKRSPEHSASFSALASALSCKHICLPNFKETSPSRWGCAAEILIAQAAGSDSFLLLLWIVGCGCGLGLFSVLVPIILPQLMTKKQGTYLRGSLPDATMSVSWWLVGASYMSLPRTTLRMWSIVIIPI